MKEIAMFQKIKFELTNTNIDYERLRGDVCVSYGTWPRPTLTYYYFNDYDYFESLLPEKMFYGEVIPYQVFLAEITGSGHLLPHIDHNISVSANYYLETNGATTYFYNKTPNARGTIYPGKTLANIYSLDQVTRVAEFTAKQNELYLLDVSQIHSVDSLNTATRRFISWQWVDTLFDRLGDHCMSQYNPINGY